LRSILILLSLLIFSNAFSKNYPSKIVVNRDVFEITSYADIKDVVQEGLETHFRIRPYFAPNKPSFKLKGFYDIFTSEVSIKFDNFQTKTEIKADIEVYGFFKDEPAERKCIVSIIPIKLSRLSSSKTYKLKMKEINCTVIKN